MKLLDLCAGAGGLSLGAKRARFDVYGIELDPEACETHRRNVGPCTNRDITTVSIGGDPFYDVVAGGVPCQPFSMAGQREGIADPRGGLYRHLVRIGTEAGAQAIVMENVRGLLSWKTPNGARMVDVVRDEFLRAGYNVDHTLLDAKSFGVPQTRHRVFIVGFRDPKAGNRFHWPTPTHGPGLLPYVTVREALQLGPGSFRTFSGNRDVGFQGMRSVGVDAPAPTVNTRNNAGWIEPLDAPSPCITAGENRSCLSFGSDGAKTRPRRAGDVLNPSLRARLTPAQCATLQGFPPEFEWVAKTRASLFRQIGNAVPPALAEAVLRQVRKALET